MFEQDELRLITLALRFTASRAAEINPELAHKAQELLGNLIQDRIVERKREGRA